MNKKITLKGKGKRSILSFLKKEKYKEYETLEISNDGDLDYYSINIAYRIIDKNPGNVKKIIFLNIPRSYISSDKMEISKIDTSFAYKEEFYDYNDEEYYDNCKYNYDIKFKNKI